MVLLSAQTPSSQEQAGSQQQKTKPEQASPGRALPPNIDNVAAQPQAPGPSSDQRPSDGPVEGWTAEKSLVVLTFVLAVLAFLQWRTYVQTLAANKEIERAYVDISHAPEGLGFVAGRPPTLKLSVKNHGRSPGDVTSFILSMIVVEPGGELPDAIAYPWQPVKTHPAQLTLMPSEKVSLTMMDNWAPLDQAAIEKFRSGKASLFIVGYVDYIDRFGSRHRSGYARRFEPAAREGTNNLIFVTKPGYNYDRDRKRGEGVDW